MKLTEVKKYLTVKNLFDSPKISRLGKGNNYQVFKIEENGESFSLRMSRTDVLSDNRLRHEFFILKFLNEEGIEFVQKPVFYDRQKKISLLTYVPGKEYAVSGLNKKKLEKFIEQLYVLHSLKYKKFQSFCKKNRFSVGPPQTTSDAVKKYGFKRFDFVLKNVKGLAEIDWVKPKLEDSIAFAKGNDFKTKLIFNHKDLAGANIFSDKEKLYFIDWDKGKFLQSIDFGLSYMFIHDDKCFKAKQKKIIKLYSDVAKISEDELWERVNRKFKIIKVNDIIWSLMMFAATKKEGGGDANRYLRLTKRRIKEYEKYD